jgi:hypothetical protein
MTRALRVRRDHFPERCHSDDQGPRLGSAIRSCNAEFRGWVVLDDKFQRYRLLGVVGCRSVL